MVHNPHAGPLPINDGQQGKSSPIRLFRSFARKDPQLYPLASIMIGTMAVVGYFVYGRTEEIPRTPNKIDRLPNKTASGNSGSTTSG